ncbi:hypothetical protein K1719_019661 [Acacia pycnantha]|nr:hypothetical protein K1719_019661 [Acacia pycnantha]
MTYDFISPEDWREFVASRQNPEFLETSQANRERQAKNKYPHCLSRGGYRKLERKMMEEELQRMKEASQSDPSTTIQAPQRPPRHKKWKAARMKGDKYINEDVLCGCLKDHFHLLLTYSIDQLGSSSYLTLDIHHPHMYSPDDHEGSSGWRRFCLATTLAGSGNGSDPMRCGKLSLALRPRILKAALS